MGLFLIELENMYDVYQIDTFTDKIFNGNPACIVPLDSWLPDKVMLNIAKENAIPETAFFVFKETKIALRWFTPEIEMDLCGHATLAAAHCLMSSLNYTKEKIIFDTISGDLEVIKSEDYYHLNLPSREPEKADLPSIIKESINIQPNEVLKSRDYVLIYETQEQIENIKINRQIFDKINLDPGGVIVTSIGTKSDFVSRFFTPQASILEDPVTGSAHCSLTPFWSKKLNKKKLIAFQLSERGGSLICENKGDRVIISGQAKTYMEGSFFIN